LRREFRVAKRHLRAALHHQAHRFFHLPLVGIALFDQAQGKPWALKTR